jgi:ABC-type multidrug transport system fused ATPase/permease subunit
LVSLLGFNNILYVTLGFASFALSFLTNCLWALAGDRQIQRLRNALFASVIRKEIVFFDKYSSGDLNSKLTK